MTTAGERLTKADLTRPRENPSDDDAPRVIEPATDDGTDTPLLPEEDGARFRDRWQEIQVRFVDEPREAVQEADGLVAELMQRLATSFADERGRLEAGWEQRDEVSTEDLRRSLQRYRSFFHRLLAA